MSCRIFHLSQTVSAYARVSTAGESIPCSSADTAFSSAFALTVFSAALLTPLSAAHAVPPKNQKAVAHPAADKADAIDPELKAAIDPPLPSAVYPNANYARLLDLGNVTVKSDGTVVARYRMTYKLYNERARELAEVNLPYNSSYQSIHVVSARTIKKDGTVVPVKRADIRTTAQAGDYLMYDDAQGYGFSMPGIEDGCVIDYTWEEITHPMLMPGQFTTYWGFNGPEPVGVSRYVLHTPTDKPLKFKTYNDDSLKPVITTSLDGKTRTYTWEIKNAKPLDIEPSMPDYDDVHTWMEVSSVDSWQDIAKWFWGLQSPQAKPTDAIKKTVEHADRRQTDGRRESPRDLRLGRQPYPLCRAGVRHLRVQAALRRRGA